MNGQLNLIGLSNVVQVSKASATIKPAIRIHKTGF